MEFSQVLQWLLWDFVMLWSKPLASCVCFSENECNEVKELIVCTCATQATERFASGYLVAIPGEKSPVYVPAK